MRNPVKLCSEGFVILNLILKNCNEFLQLTKIHLNKYASDTT